MSDNDFMGFRCTFHVRPEAKIHREHNIRDAKLIKYEKHIDQSKYSETTLDLGTLDEAYKTIFGDSLEQYNKGKRKDRQIKNYLEEVIRTDKRKGKHKNQKADGTRKAAYEAYITIGNRDNQPNHEKSLKVLKLFVEKWIPEHYPQIKPICISYHDDEFSLDDKTGERIYSAPHCHFDYVYIANALTPEEQKEEKKYRAEQKQIMIDECKAKGIPFDEKAWEKKDWQEDLVRRTGKSLSTGLTLQSSMSGALAQMGFKTGKGKQTAQIQFEERVRHDLEDFAESMGLKIDRTPGVKHSHAEKNVYQQKKDNERKELELNDRESSIINGEKEIEDRMVEIQTKEDGLAEQMKLNNIQKELIHFEATRNKEEMAKFKDTISSLEKRENNLIIQKEILDKQALKNSEMALVNKTDSEKLKKEEQRISLDRSHLEYEKNMHAFEKEKLESQQKEVRGKEWDLYGEREKLEKLTDELSKRESELSSRERCVDIDEQQLEEDKKRFSKNKEQIIYFEKITTQVQINHLTIDKAVKEFDEKKNIFPLKDVLTEFVDKVKKCITSITTKLEKYKKAFQDFWKWTPNHFRKLADKMEQEHCDTYEDFFNRSLTGEVRGGGYIASSLSSNETKMPKRINRDYDGLSW